jgi:small subunit ribosomal protein S4e
MFFTIFVLLYFQRCYRVTNIFVIGEGIKPWISLPKGKGTKLTISEERDVKRKQRAEQ